MALIGSNVGVTTPENYFEGFKKMRDDPSCLFSYTNHGYFSKRYLGNVSEMVEDYDRARAEMARVGASELEQRTVAYPYGAHDKALVNALIDAGYYSARGGDDRFPATRSAFWGAGDSSRMAMALITSADSVTNSYAAVTAAIEKWRTTVGDTASIVWHVPAETDGAPGVTQIGRQKMEQLFQFVAGERDAGRIVLTSLAAITSQFTGMPTDRR